MKIGIDTRLPLKEKTGMGYLAQNLVSGMVDISKKNSDEVTLIGDSIGNYNNVKYIKLSGIVKRGLNFIWRYLPVPVNLLGKPFDAFLFPNFVDFPVRAKRKVVIIGDLSFLKYPDFIEKKNRNYLLKYVPKAIQRSDHILAITQVVKDEIVEYYGVPEAKISVMHLAPNKDISFTGNSIELNRVRDKYGIPDNYFLSVGTIEPRKNHAVLLEAMAKMKSNTDSRYVLVIAGKKDSDYERLQLLASKLQIEDRVIFTGYIEEGDFSALYSGSKICIFSSLYEGFGIPVIEAMSCRVPVILSNIPTFHEIAGENALYFDPENAEQLVEKIRLILENPDLRQNLVDSASSSVKRFTWERSAQIAYRALFK
ncbi:MAG: glycosyltransferase family 1 protein [Patescibacteria group bacterium]